MSKRTERTQTFLERYVIGEVCADDIDDYVGAWHAHPDQQELHKFLGMSKEEYAAWLRDPEALAEIARARRERRALPPAE
jgi:truncated hemoglobin YjbI